MSAPLMKQLVEAQNVWDSGTQAAAMTLLCWYHSEGSGHASVSFGRIARWCGVKRRYVIRLMEQLELEKEACVNIGPDPEQGGRNRWQVTLDKAIAKARRQAGVGVDVPLARLEPRSERRRRPSTVVIPGSPPSEQISAAEPVENDLRFLSGGLQTTTPVIPGSPPGDPWITTPVIPGSPQSSTGSNKGEEGSLRIATGADAPAASLSLDFTLIGETPPAHRHDKTAKLAADARRSRLYHRIVRHARWLLEHPVDASALNAGAPIATESDLFFVTKERCRLKRIPGYAEGDVLANACRSEWHLLSVRNALNAVRPRDLRHVEKGAMFDRDGRRRRR